MTSLLNMLLYRDEFFKVGKATKDKSLIELAREYRNKLKTGIKNARYDYYLIKLMNTVLIHQNFGKQSKN